MADCESRFSRQLVALVGGLEILGVQVRIEGVSQLIQSDRLLEVASPAGLEAFAQQLLGLLATGRGGLSCGGGQAGQNRHDGQHACQQSKPVCCSNSAHRHLPSFGQNWGQ